MSQKHYYAITKDGHRALRFDSDALRDFFIEREPDHDYIKATRDQYLKVEQRSKREYDFRYRPNLYRAYDMCDPDVPEWWDGWYDIRDDARAAGLLP